MSSPLDPDADFVADVNGKTRYSMWPAPVAAPGAWATAHGPLTGANNRFDVWLVNV